MRFQRTGAYRFACQFFTLILTMLHIFKALGSNSALESTLLKAGDVLLVPLNCYVCNAIEKETGVPYSHSVVVATTTHNHNDAFVYEAWGEVKRTPLTEIFERAQKGQSLFHLRPVEFHSDPRSDSELSLIFREKFERLPFDDLFLWNNFDESGNEKLYCSEFVLKFINSFLKDPEPPTPMSFVTLQDFWKKYYLQFERDVPEGEPGVSPATLYQSSRFEKLGLLVNSTTPRK